jgi:predicted RNase H-like nuclease (RuvC/YqgF family)
MSNRFLRLAAVASLTLALAPVAAQDSQDSLDALAEELVSLRGQVESLNTELNRMQEQHRAEMNSLAAQKGDLEATRRREELRIRQLEQDLEENRERALRLTRDNGLYSQIIPLGGDRVLADIAKIGALAIYFQTRDGRSGYATRSGEEWSFTVTESGAERQQIAELFDSLKKQIRTGLFELPNGSIRMESES